MKSYIIAPLVGALIGYITNYIAIKMLFRPLHAKYLFGIKIPFTPGIIPREKNRIAKSIGSAVGEKLLTNEIIIQTLTSTEFHQKLEEFADQKIKTIKTSNTLTKDAIKSLLGAEESEMILNKIKNHSANFLYEKINDPDVISKITAHISSGLDHYIEKQLSNPLIKMALSFNTGIVDSIKENIISKIREMLYTNSHDIIEALVQNEIEGILHMELKTIAEKYMTDPSSIRATIINCFDHIVRTNIHAITNALDISAMVEKQINDYDVLEVEHLILDIIDK
jgi:uncharacterized membrane protein YheB (UPF0754 family)